MSKLPKELSPGEEAFAQHCMELLHPAKHPMREAELIPGRKWRFDFYFPKDNLAVEIEGATKYGRSRHSRGEGFEEDCRKYNAASLQGIKLLRFTTEMVIAGEAIDTVIKVLK